MAVPINILTAKLGFGLTDSTVLCLSIIQIVSQSIASYAYKKLEQKNGSRNIMVLIYPLVWILTLYWLLSPVKTCFLLAIFPFVVGGMRLAFFSTTLANYFMISIPNRLQVGGRYLVFVITGGMMGALGVCLNPLILSGIKFFPLLKELSYTRSIFLSQA